ncbi:tRNA lysidine(34) synthetase TilS [Marinivivus vitaminiproducens]|uniref:tRNA lysidine(34) synthetase TilS n=1 Tax=Marinivivus vitaminiproducens TaxID=3035935 RepID=UPI0027A8198D|nr:tRNA lysidine(34) synthetase TilS [Geminicoccaceae bacterium SCSIO 64248]
MSAAVSPARADRAAFAEAMRRFAPYETEPHLAIGVSGGADSMALAVLARDWVRPRGGRVTALVVDHGLRPGSDADAAQAEAWLRALGIDVVRLAWTGTKPATGVQAAARAARHRLMGTWCREAGVLHLLLGHHADDHAETVRMRCDRGSGEDGLAGIPAVAQRPGHRLLRPLLAWPKARLVALLRSGGQPWIDDPSNRDPRFMRARLRRTAIEPPSPRHEEARRRRDRRLACWLARHVTADPAGCAWVDPAGFGDDVAVAGMRRVLTSIGGRPYPPAETACARLVRDVAEPTGWRRYTLAGCVVHRRGDTALVRREPGGVTECLPAVPGEPLLWDGRFLCETKGAPGSTIRALGSADPASPLIWHDCRLLRLDPAVRACLPALWAIDRVVALPHLDVRRPGQPVGEPSFRVAFAPRHGFTEAAFAGKTILA